MGCCQSTENNLKTPQLLNRTVSLSKQYTSVNQASLSKKFNLQIEQLKSLGSFFDSSLQSCLNSSSGYLSSLQSLDFYFSSKDLSEPITIPDSFTCTDCLITFDPENHVPLNLSCGHTLCKPCCVSKYNKDSKIKCSYNCEPETLDPESLIINSPLVSNIIYFEKGLFCYEHCEPTENFCVNCKKIICDNCFNAHPKHQILNITKPEFVNQVNNWKKSMEDYKKKNQENVELVLRHKKKYEELKVLLADNLESHIEVIKQGVSNIKERIIESAEDTENSLKGFVKHLDEIVPNKELELYKDMISQELEKARSLSEQANLVGVAALKELGKVELKSFKKITEANIRPWENSLKDLEETMKNEFLLLALTSLKFA